jgi:putative peptidoglycan binding protein
MMLDAALVLGPAFQALRYRLAVSITRNPKPSLLVLAAIFCLLATSLGWAEAKTHSTPTPARQIAKSSKSGKVHRAKSRRRGSWKKRGQKEIDDQRCRAIQEALVREKYLDGEPTGRWDDHSKAAMQKYQQDNGWQTKVVPDSRAIIKLGLGPSNEGLINPDTAATAMSSAPALTVEKSSSGASGRSGGSH